MTGPSGLVVCVGVGADPGDQDAVGMVDEVVAGEGVDTVGVAGDVGDGDRDDLAVAVVCATPAARCSRSPERGEQCGGHHGGHVVTGVGPLDDLGDGGVAAHHQVMDHVVGFGGHGAAWAAPLTPRCHEGSGVPWGW